MTYELVNILGFAWSSVHGKEGTPTHEVSVNPIAWHRECDRHHLGGLGSELGHLLRYLVSGDLLRDVLEDLFIS
jgi:hypothetical protein